MEFVLTDEIITIGLRKTPMKQNVTIKDVDGLTSVVSLKIIIPAFGYARETF